MGKKVKWPVLVIVIILAFAAGFALSYSFPFLSIKPAETGQIPNTNIFAIKNRMGAAFFCKTNDGYILIDAGTDARKFEASLNETGIDVNAVKWIFLTHSDADHVAALAMFPNAAIYMGEDELPLANGTLKRSTFIRNKMPGGVDINKIILLRDGQELSCGGTKVECIKTPGHTIGSMTYLADGKFLFTGDAFKLKDGVMSVHPFTMDAELSKKTMERLKEIMKGSSIVLTSHYGYEMVTDTI